MAANFKRRVALFSEPFLPHYRPSLSAVLDPLREPYLRFEWGVVAFAAGIALYFALPFELTMLWITSAGLGLSVLLGWTGWVRRRYMTVAVTIWRYEGVWIVILVVWLTMAGLGRSVWHSQSMATPFLPEQRQAYTITGWIAAVETAGTGLRWRLNVLELEARGEPVDPHHIPKTLRVKTDTSTIPVGATITIRALMTAPPGPVVPSGYDPARRAYFEGVGGYGFAIGPAEQLSDAILPLPGHFARQIARFRYGVAERIRALAPQDTAGVQVALLTGIRTYIPPEQTEALRSAGLAHMLAISGLHMGLLAGGGFYLTSLLLAMIAPLSRRYDVRKFAAVIGALMATAYLILSGAGVSTQRAYIMAIIVFLAVILDRPALSMRSIALAAIITLMLHPEALISAGFQMSFSAAAALIVFYRAWRRWRMGSYRPGLVAVIWRNLTGIALTSLVAGFATGGFAVLHFNRFVRYDVLGNILAMPLFTFLAMPAALVSLIAMPFGMDLLPLAVMGYGLSHIISIADWVAALEGALIYIPAPPPGTVALYGLGFTALCLGGWQARGLGLGIIGACFLYWTLHPIPDMRISDTGQVAFWNGADRSQLYVTGKRGDRYGREQFIRRAGRTDIAQYLYKEDRAQCDSQACRFLLKGQQVSVVSTPESLLEVCHTADIVIVTKRMAGPRIRRSCSAQLLDQRYFERYGASDIYIDEDDGEGSIKIRHAKTFARQNRVWAKGFKVRPNEGR